ncbi:MAG TPA: hypothetical protein VFS43_30690 [Polyangiaceae bacterium]|nr:hypothetical protein [Polyangiaceae bacterium]
MFEPFEPEEWAPPERVEEYELLRPIGRGAMGRVYLAHDRLLDRLVAIKFVARAVLTHGTRSRFFTEARGAARLSHPNVVTDGGAREGSRGIPGEQAETMDGAAGARRIRHVGP